MRVLKSVLLDLALGIFLIDLGIAQNYQNVTEILNNLDINLIGAGARAEGFGGAFIGVADDATSIVWNPAGLATLERPEASVVARTIAQKAEFSDTQSPEYNNTQNVGQVTLNFGSVAYPLRSGGSNVVLALAYQQQINLRKVFKISNDFDIENTGSANTMSPAIGIRLMPVLSVGVAANFWFGKLDQSQTSNYTYLDSLGNPYANEYHFTSSGTLSGTNVVFGVLVDLSELQSPIPLKLGVSCKTPFDLKLTGTENYHYSPPPFDTTGNTTQTIEMPLMLGFGVSYRIGDNLTVAADYEIRQFKDKKLVFHDDLGNNNTGPVSEANSNLNQLRIGAEYLVVAKEGVFPLRVGYRTVPTVLANMNPSYDADGNYHPNYSSEVSGTAFSIGTGFISNRFALDAAYTYTSYTQSTGPTSQIKYSSGVISASLIVYF
jgi:long-subunit fatty acid transport protein